MGEDAEAIADRLESIAEELGDLVMADLRRQLEEPETGRDREKLLARARRSVDKAVHLLRSGDPGGGS